MTKQIAVFLALALSACGGSSAPPAAPSDPVATAAPAAAQASTNSPYEGIWSGISYSAVPGYPALIVDAQGNYWSESANWICGSYNSFSGVISASTMTVLQWTVETQECHGADSLAVASIAISAGELTLEGTLTGNDYEGADGSFSQSDPAAPAMAFSWLMSATLENAAPAALAPGNYITAWGGKLTIGAGTFMLNDNVPGSIDTYNCTFSGQITQDGKVYSMTGSAQEPSGTGVTITGVFTVASDGQLQGGVWDASGACVSLLDTSTA